VSAADARWIATSKALAAAVDRWRSGSALGLDTEFVFERTFRPRLGLVQVAAGDEIGLVDPLGCDDLEPLGELVADIARRVVVHSGSADVPIVRRACRRAPARLFDTQIAAAFAGLGSGISYGALVSALFGVELPKHETRTDWLRRPLRQEQLRYAAEDVEHLLPAAAELERRLGELGRLEWVLEESARLLEIEEAPPEEAWRRLRGIGRLPPRERAVARELAAWREREAERRDLARPFLLRDETLLALARLDDPSDERLAKLPGYDERRHTRWRAAWAEALVAARDGARDEPEPPRERPGRAAIERRDRLDRALADAVADIAGGLELPPELLLSRRQRQQLVAATESGSAPSTALAGFRLALLGDAVDAAARRR